MDEANILFLTGAEKKPLPVDDQGDGFPVNPGPLAYGTDTAGIAQRDDLRNNWYVYVSGASTNSIKAAGGVGTYHVVTGYRISNINTWGSFLLKVDGVIVEVVQGVTISESVTLPVPIKAGENSAVEIDVTGGDAGGNCFVTLYGYTI